MQRLAFGLALTSASLFVFATALLTSPAMAFETQSGAVSVPGASTQFQDPDEQPLFSSKQGEDGVSLQMGTETNSDGLQTAPSTNSTNPADNRALIPSP
jgi:hypothetical protein